MSAGSFSSKIASNMVLLKLLKLLKLLMLHAIFDAFTLRGTLTNITHPGAQHWMGTRVRMY